MGERFGREPVAFSLADVLGAIAARQPALVALVGGEVAGAISARVDGERAWCSAGRSRPNSEGKGSAADDSVAELGGQWLTEEL